MNQSGGLSKRLSVKLKGASSDIRQGTKRVYAFRAIQEIVGITVVINIHAELNRVLSEHCCHIVSEFVTMIAGRKLKAITAKYKSAVRILDDYCRAGSWSSRQIEMIVISIVEAEFVLRGTTNNSLQGNLKELAGCAIRKRE